MKKFKNRALVALATLSPFAIFAEGEQSASQQVTTQVTQMMTDANTSLTNLLVQALPIIGAILGASIVLWAGFKLFRLIMKAFGWGAR